MVPQSHELAQLNLSQSQCELNHLWIGRRACVRVRTELMAAIYAKALKRKDYSGIVDKDKLREAADKKADAANVNASAAGACGDPLSVMVTDETVLQTRRKQSRRKMREQIRPTT